MEGIHGVAIMIDRHLTDQHKQRIGAAARIRFLTSFDHTIYARALALHASGLNCKQVATAIGRPYVTVWRWLRLTPSRAQGENFTGRARTPGPWQSTNGYVRQTATDGRQRYQHRIVAEAALGRPLCSGEAVHHINCNRLDNRPENLLICTLSYHTALHRRMRKHPYWSQFEKGKP